MTRKNHVGHNEYPVVLVTWVDAVYQACQSKIIPYPIYRDSVGFLIEDNKDFIVLAPNLTISDDEESLGSFSIPATSISSVKELKVVEIKGDGDSDTTDGVVACDADNGIIEFADGKIVDIPGRTVYERSGFVPTRGAKDEEHWGK